MSKSWFLIVVSIVAIIVVINIPYTTLEPYVEREYYTEKEPYKDMEYYTEKEPYTTVETIYVKEPYEDIENVAVNYQETIKTQWNVTWYTITGDGQWGSSVGTSTFPSTFNYNWGEGTVFGGYYNYIGLIATSTVNVPQNRPVNFIIGGDDGIRLYIDGNLVIDDYDTHSYRTISKTIDLSSGKHSLVLYYYEWTTYARISFDSDADILTWQEQRTRTEQQKVVKYKDIPKDITVTKYKDVQKSRETIKYKDVQKSRDILKTKDIKSSLLQRIEKYLSENI